jgi:hypothetical protein
LWAVVLRQGFAAAALFAGMRQGEPLDQVLENKSREDQSTTTKVS